MNEEIEGNKKLFNHDSDFKRRLTSKDGSRVNDDTPSFRSLIWFIIYSLGGIAIGLNFISKGYVFWGTISIIGGVVFIIYEIIKYYVYKR